MGIETVQIDSSKAPDVESSPITNDTSLPLSTTSEKHEPARDAPRQRSKSKSHADNHHKVTPPEGAQPLEGVVVSKEERKNYGFIKCKSTDGRYFFHMKDVIDDITSNGAHVKFFLATDPSTGKEVACNVQTIADRPSHEPRNGTKQLREEKIPGAFSGNVIAMPQGPPTHHIDDGMIFFIDEDGKQQQAMFGAWRVDGDHQVSLGCEVEFQLRKNPSTKVLKASHVKVVVVSPQSNMNGDASMNGQHSAPPGLGHEDEASTTTTKKDTKSKKQQNNNNSDSTTDTADTTTATSEESSPTTTTTTKQPSRGLQYGRIALLKKEFGFIRQVSRPGDLFFHFSNLKGFDPETDPIKVGDDVQYIVKKDKDGRASAQNVTRAPPGAVVFDIISDTVYEGIVLEKPVSTKQYVHSSGVLEYVDKDADDDTNNGGDINGKKLRIIFSAMDCKSGATSCKPGDHATFKIATNIAAAKAAAAATVPGVAKVAGKRAVDVSVVRKVGHVANVYQQKKIGFIVYGSDNEQSVEKKVDIFESLLDDIDALLKEEKKEKGNGGEEAATDTATATVTADGENGNDAEGENGGDTQQQSSKKQDQQQQQRIFFHFSEVSGGLLLKPGDEVSFIMHTNLKTGEVNASRVKRIKEGPSSTAHPRKERENIVAVESIPEHNPNKTKYVGNLQVGEHKTQHMPKMPDGTSGFTFGRGKALESMFSATNESSAPGSNNHTENENDNSLSVYDLFAGLHLKGIVPSMTRSLSVEAKPFVPRSASSLSLGEGVSMESSVVV